MPGAEPLNKHRSTAIFRTTFLFVVSVIFLGLTGVAQAQDADPPSRVARLNFIQGDISFQPAGTQDWLEANPNRPLTTGDQLWSDVDSQGELHLGGAVLRVSSQTAISFLNLADNAVQVQVAQGSADLRVLHLEQDENYEIDTPNSAFSILRPGEYRVDVSADGTSSIVTVQAGAGEVTAGGQAYNVAPVLQYIFSGTDQVGYDEEPLPGPDAFQQWYLARDQREDRFQSAQYVSRDVIGYEDLDANGTWRADPVYGHVWIPNGVAVGWAPYHYGHWAYVAPWGWTWVEDEPWGFAPFHYGRWAIVGGAWGWVPGPAPVVGAVYVRPVYAPALVAFVGGGGFAASIDIGGAAGVGVAWFPLGPRDVWVPSYHVSAVYMTNVNVTNSVVINRTQITNVYNTTVVNRTTVVNTTYMYQSSPGAVTAVSKSAFQNGEPVGKAAVQVNAQEIQHARVVETAAIAPTPRAIAGPNAPARTSARPPAALASRPVVTKMAPSARAIPVGQTKPAAPTAYRSMANAKPPTAHPVVQRAAPANKAAQPSAARPPAVQTARPNAAPAIRPAPAEQPVERSNQPEERKEEAPVNKPAPTPDRTPPPSRTTEAPAEKPAPPPARETAPKQTPAPEAKAPPREPAPEAKKPNPPPKETKPPKDEKDKDKDKDKN
jgi:hypothetical protein